MITDGEPDPVGLARWWLAVAEHDPRVALVVNRLVGELDARVRTDAEDKTHWPPAVVVADRYRLLVRMAHRYQRSSSRHPAAALMLAAIYQLRGSGQLHAV